MKKFPDCFYHFWDSGILGGGNQGNDGNIRLKNSGTRHPPITTNEVYYGRWANCQLPIVFFSDTAGILN